MTNAELNAMPWTASLMTTDELFEWLASRKRAALAIDIEFLRTRPVEVLRCRPIRRARLVVGGFRHQVVRPHAGKSRLDRGGGSAGRQIRGDDGQGRAARAGDRSRRMSPVPSLSPPHMAADCSVGCGGGSKRSSNTAKSHRPPSLASRFHEWQRIAGNAPWPRPARSGGRGQSDPRRPLRTVRRCFLGREVAVDEF